MHAQRHQFKTSDNNTQNLGARSCSKCRLQLVVFFSYSWRLRFLDFSQSEALQYIMSGRAQPFSNAWKLDHHVSSKLAPQKELRGGLSPPLWKQKDSSFMNICLPFHIPSSLPIHSRLPVAVSWCRSVEVVFKTDSDRCVWFAPVAQAAKTNWDIVWMTKINSLVTCDCATCH